MEPKAGIEPANLILTKDALYQLSYLGSASQPDLLPALSLPFRATILERETGFEPATLSLEG